MNILVKPAETFGNLKKKYRLPWIPRYCCDRMKQAHEDSDIYFAESETANCHLAMSFKGKSTSFSYCPFSGEKLQILILENLEGMRK